MILDGRLLAAKVLMRTKERAQKLPHPPRVVALIGEDTPASRSYLSIKKKRAADAGCLFEERPLGAPTDDADAVIVQLPLPKDADMHAVLDTIELGKDADVLSTLARMRFEADEPGALIPPVAATLAEILREAGIDPKGKRAAVVGAGWLVGKPCATWLTHAGAEVTHLTTPESDLAPLASADIVVLGAGSPYLVGPDHIQEGTILFDAGASEVGGAIVGDAEPDCALKCAVFTPVPGGVGPVAVAKLFENAVILAEKAMKAA